MIRRFYADVPVTDELVREKGMDWIAANLVLDPDGKKPASIISHHKLAADDLSAEKRNWAKQNGVTVYRFFGTSE